MSATKNTSSITVDREAFEEILIELGGLGDFADRVYGGNDCEGFLWHELLSVQRRLFAAAGGDVDDEPAAERRREAESRHERTLLEKFSARLGVAGDRNA